MAQVATTRQEPPAPDADNRRHPPEGPRGAPVGPCGSPRPRAGLAGRGGGGARRWSRCAPGRRTGIAAQTQLAQLEARYATAGPARLGTRMPGATPAPARTGGTGVSYWPRTPGTGPVLLVAGLPTPPAGAHLPSLADRRRPGRARPAWCPPTRAPAPRHWSSTGLAGASKVGLTVGAGRRLGAAHHYPGRAVRPARVSAGRSGRTDTSGATPLRRGAGRGRCSVMRTVHGGHGSGRWAAATSRRDPRAARAVGHRGGRVVPVQDERDLHRGRCHRRGWRPPDRPVSGCGVRTRSD